MTAAYHSLASVKFQQNWSNAGLITANDDWSLVPSIMGYLGDIDAGTTTNVDARTLTGASLGAVDVNANNATANFVTGGVTEFDLADDTIGFVGSGAADAPCIVLYLDASGRTNIHLQCNLRDLDPSGDDAAQQINIQYRTSPGGTWTNVPGGYFADVTTVSTATQVTVVDLILPSGADNASTLEIRIMTTNAGGNDESVGIDDIVVSSVGTLAINDVTAAEGSVGTTDFTFIVTRSSGSDGAVSATWTLGAPGGLGNADGADFTGATSGTVSFADGETSKMITVTVNGDLAFESNEAFTITLSAPTGGATITDATGAGLIDDDDDGATGGDDFINGTPGNDTFHGLAGDDVIFGGNGNDQSFGDAGVDLLTGDAGNDILHGGDNDDTLHGGNDDDQLYGDGGNDYLRGGAGTNLVDGGGGNDRAAYFTAPNGVTVDLRLQGSAQNTGWGIDTLVGIENVSGTIYADTLYGDDSDNWLWANTLGGAAYDQPTNDNLYGNGGNDLLEANSGDHILDGGTGTDALYFGHPSEILQATPDPMNGIPDGIIINLGVQGVAQDTGQGMMTLISIENASGSIFDDHILGDGNANTLAGDAGSDTLEGGGGDDILYGDGAIRPDYGTPGLSGPITLFTVDQGTGVDFYDADGDLVFRYTGGDLYDADGNAYPRVDHGDHSTFTVNMVDYDFYLDQPTTTDGAAGNDVLFGGYGNDLLDGGGGDDFLLGGFGNDILTGGAGLDSASFLDDDAASGVTVDLRIAVAQNTGQGMDTLSGIEHLDGTQFADTLTGDDNDNWLSSAQQLVGNDDTMDGQGGDDQITVGIGNNIVTGGTGNDTLRFVNGISPTTAITLSLAAQGGVQATGAGNWTVDGFENLSGGRAGDHLIGDGGANRLTGELGNDVLEGGAGDDILSGDASWNVGFHANGTVASMGALRFLSGATGSDSLDGGAGDDTAVFLLEAGAGALSYAADGADYLVKRDGVDIARISFSGDTTTVTGLGPAANLGTDTLVNIEHIRFAIDGSATELVFNLGVVVDGYISGATVFVDSVQNNMLDVGEASTITDANGNFTLPGGGPLFMYGGVDIATGLDNILEYRAPEGSTVVSPLTTLVQFLILNNSMTVEQAQDAVAAAFGIDTDIDLTSFDPFDAPLGSEADALAVEQAAAQVMVLVQLGGALDGNDDGTQSVLFAAVADHLANNPGLVDLTDDTVVLDILDDVLTSPDPAAAGNIADHNAAIAAATSLAEIAEAQQAALSVSVGDLVFLDVNLNGVFDSGIDSGIDGVTVQLLDSTATSVLDSTTTVGGGLYSFTGLSAGDYVVRVLGSTLPAGYSSVPGATDPDDNVDNDDNGTPNGANYDSAPITLTPDDEPDGTTNNTLDFGFRAAAGPSVDLDGAAGGDNYSGSFTEGGAASPIGSNITVTAPGLPITSATITITDPLAGDALSVTGTLPATITVLSNSGTVLVLSGTGSATDWEDALELVRYANNGDNPDAFGADTARSISVTVSDGVTPSAPATATIAITALNDAPTVGAFGDAVSYTESDAYVLLDLGDNATVSDPDSLNFAGGNLSFGMLTTPLPEDSIFIQPNGTVTLSGSDVLVGGVVIGTIAANGPGEMLRIEFDADATPAAVQNLLRAIAYTNTAGDDPTAGGRTFTWILNDGDGGGTGAGVTVNVTAENDAPDLSAPTNATVTFTENGAAAALFGGTTVTDPDNPIDYTSGGFTLAIDGSGGGIVFLPGSRFEAQGADPFDLYDNLTDEVIGVITGLGTQTVTVSSFDEDATQEAVDALIQSFGFTIAGFNPSVGSRTATLTFNDGGNDGTGGALTDQQTQSVNVVLQPVHLYDGSDNLVGAFATIQAAIDAASDGYRIEAAAGTYTENLTVDVDVTIQGANVGTAGTGARGAESVINGQVTISVAGITIDGFSITGSGAGTLGTTGVVVEGGANNFSLVNSILNGSGDLGMIVGLVTGLDVGGNLIEGYATGMYVAGGGTTGSIHDNRFQGAGGPPTGLVIGLQSETTLVTIEDNIFDGIYGGSLFLFPSGPDSVDLDSYIIDNTITDSGADRPVQILPTNLTHNVIGTDFNEAFDGETAALNGVTGAFSFDGQGGDDRAWGGEAGDTFTGGAGNEALFGNGGADTAVYAGPRADYTIVYTTDSNGVVTGFTSVTDTNIVGLNEGTDTLTSIERLQFADATLDLGQRVQLFDGGGNLVGTFNDIQAAIDAASDGYRIEAAAGTYTENLTVDKDVTIEGANTGIAGTGARGAESVINGQVTISVAGVTIDGFSITGSGAGTLGTTGVVVEGGANNFSLVNSILNGTGDLGMIVGLVTGLNVGGNLIEGYATGMYVAGGGTTGSIHDNRFQGAGGPPTGLINGLQSETTLVTIEDNIFDGIYGGSLFLFPSGPDTVDLDSYIIGNTITDSGADRPVQILPTNLTHNVIGTDFNEAFDGETAALNGVTGAFSFDGQGGDDRAWGGGENDTFTGGAGDDRLFGNAGDDNAIYSGNRSDYTVILLSPGVVQITDNRPGSPDGTDQIEGVERVVFANNDYWVEPNGTLTVINDAPLGIDHSLTIDEDVVHAFSVADFSFTDTEGNQLLEVTIVDLPAAGTIYYDADGAGIGQPVAILAGATFSAADLNAGLLTYVPANNANGPNYATFTYQVRDNGGTAHGGADTDPVKNVITVNVTPVNDAPDLSAPTDAIVTFTEHGAATALFGGTTVTDPDNPTDYTSGGFTLTIDGSGGGIVFLPGSRFEAQGSDPFDLYDTQTGEVIGVITGLGTQTVTVSSFDEDATQEAVDALIQSFGFVIAGDDPSAGSRTATLTFSDGGNDGTGGALTDQQTQMVDVVAINDEPTLTATTANPTYIEDAAASDLFSGVTVSTVELGQTIASLTLTVTNVTDGASEILRFDGSDVALTNGNSVTSATNGLTVNVSVAGSTATVSFSGASLSEAQVQTLVDALSYRNASQNPTDADRVVTLTQLVDSGSNVAPNDNVRTLAIASTVNAEPVNDAPTSTLLANDMRTYTEGSAPVTLDVSGNATIADVDSANFGGGSLTLTFAAPLAEDNLLIINTAIVTTSGNSVSVNGTAIGTFSGGGGGTPLVFSFNTDATPAAVQLLVRAIGYTNGGGDIPTGGLRTIGWALNDGDGNALGGNPILGFNTRVNVQPVNDPPSGADVTVEIDEDEVYYFSTADFAFFDIEGDLPAGVRISSSPANGVLFFDPDGNGPGLPFQASPGVTIGWSDIQAGRFYYVPDADGNGIDSFTFAVVDSGGATDTSPNIFTLDVQPVNDAAIITGDDSGDVTEAGGVANGTPGDASDSGDLDSADTDNAADVWQVVNAGTASIGGYGTYALTAAGVWTYTVDDSDAAVQALNGAATLTDTFNALTQDGTSRTVTITIHAQNDAAVFTGDTTGDVTEAGGVANGTPGADDTGDLDAADVDGNADVWQAVAPGAASLGGYGTYALNAAGVWTYTLDDSDAAVQALNGAATLTDTFNALTDDGSSQTVTITIHAQDDAADITGDAVGSVTEAGGTANGTAGDASDTGDLDATDIDNAADVWQVVNAGTASIGGYGTYALSAAGVWTYTVDDSDAAVQALNGAATLTDTFEALTEGGTSQTVTITIHAQNDAPTVDNLAGDTVAYIEGAAAVRLDAGLDAAVGDVDAGDFAAVSVGTVPGHPLDIAAIPDGSGRIFVVEYEGRIRILDPNTGITDPTPFLDVSAEVLLAGESGLLGFAVAPDFATSGVFYVFMTNLAGDNEVRRYQTFSGNPDQADPGTMDVILVIPHSTDVHNGGWLGFGPDGYLYVATGDGGSDAFDAQDPDSLNGKILRLDVSQDDFADPLRDYAIPLDNPFASGGGLGEIWALGLRNPYRNSFDPVTGNLYIGDVGGTQAEEIDLMRPTDGGANFGWPVREGTLPLNGPDSPAFTPPVAQYLHTGGITSVLGGYVYHGPIAALQNHYIFADIYGQSLALQGTLWSVPADSLVVGSTLGSAQFTLRTAAFAPDEGMNGLITGMGLDEAGNLYLADWHAGRIVRIEGGADPNFAGGRLAVAISQNKAAGEDRLQIDTSGTTITLSDGTNVGSEIRVGGVLIGFIAAGGTGVGADDLIIDFTGGATLQRIDTLIHSLSYLNTNTTEPSTATRTITYTLTDGGGTEGVPNSVTFSSTVTVEGVNDEPTLTATGGNPTYVENAAAADLFGTVAASMIESGQNFTSLTLTVTNVTDGASEILRVDGSDVALTNGNSVAGTATNGLTVNVTVVGTTATVTFAGATLSAAQLQTLVDALTYRNTSENPTNADRVVTITQLVDDGSNVSPNDNMATLSVVSTVNVDPVNDIPAIDLDSATAGQDFVAAYTENGAPVLITPNALVSDVDSPNFSGGRLGVFFASNGDIGDSFSIISTGTGPGQISTSGSDVLYEGVVIATGTHGSGSMVLNLNGNATPAAIQALLRQVAISSTRDSFAASSWNVAVELNDGDGSTFVPGSVFAGGVITINAQNDAPVVDLNGAGAGTSATLAYTENDPVVAIAPAAVMSDVDDPNYTNGHLQVTIPNGLNAEDVLLIINQGTGPGQIGYSSGTITYEGVTIGHLLPAPLFPFPILDIDFTGANVSQEAVQALIRAIGYQNLSENPSLTPRNVEFSLQDRNDAGALITVTTATINLTRVDDAPVAQPDAFTTNEATAIAGSVFVPNGSGADADVDGPALSVTAVNGSGANVGNLITLGTGALLRLNADGTFTYDPNGAFDATPTPGSGAANQPAPDSFTYTLAGGNTTTVSLTINGLDTNDTLLGTAGADTLIAGVGNDYLDPGAGADTMSGGTGNDIYWVDNAGDVVNEATGEGQDTVFARASYTLTAGSEVEVLAAGTAGAINLTGNGLANAVYGNDAANVLLGGGGNDVLAGFGGNDYLDGETGGDGMAGGAGDDIFWVDSFSDSVNEAVGEGQDTVFARSSYALTQGAEVEVLAAGTGSAIDLFGNELSNAIYGNEAANVLLGGGGNDVLAGFGGNDYLDGETGGDGMSGGAGDDLYWVDSNSDSVNEAAGEGQDTVFARVSYALTQGSHVEVLAAGVAGAIDLTGNDLANAVYGNNDANVLLGAGGNDVLAGFGGNDYLDGGTGGDGMSGGAGDDIYWVDSFSDSVNEAAGEGQDIVYARASYALTQGAEVEVLAAGVGGALDLTGNDLANQVYGNEAANSLLGAGGNDMLGGFGGNDYLDGGTGADAMTGGTGDDIYWVDNAGDAVNEAVGEGQDTVYARASYTLTAGSDVEVLAAGVAGALDLTGNALANSVYGNNDANVLNGGRGNDVLGGFGGADTYAFTTTLAGNVDRVLGFQTGVDKIALDDAIFNGLALGALAPGAFVIGSAAADADDRIIYNSATGALLFDADGNGAGAAVQFAILDGAPTLAASDFLVI